MQTFNSFNQLAASQSDGCVSDMSTFNEKIRQPADTIHAGEQMKDIYDWLHEFGSWEPQTPEEALDAVEKIDQSLRSVKNFTEAVTITLNNLRRTYDRGTCRYFDTGRFFLFACFLFDRGVCGHPCWTDWLMCAKMGMVTGKVCAERSAD